MPRCVVAIDQGTTSSRAIVFRDTNVWTFPTGSVWVQHFDLELTNGVPESRKRLETRFIVKNTNGVYGVTYRWDTATNATLVLPNPRATNDGLYRVVVRSLRGVGVKTHRPAGSLRRVSMT